jgi:hypothetical protein
MILWAVNRVVVFYLYWAVNRVVVFYLYWAVNRVVHGLFYCTHLYVVVRQARGN